MELKSIKGLGKKRIEILNEHGIYSAEDLALYFPKTYYDLDHPQPFQEDGKYKLIFATVLSEVKVVRIKSNFNYSFCECVDSFNNKFKAIWYNQTYIKSAVGCGDQLYIYGKNSTTKKNYFIVSSYKNRNKIEQKEGLLPVYKTFKNVGQSIIYESINQALNIVNIESIIPKNIENEFFELSYNNAIKNIHYAKNSEELKYAKNRIDIENILPIIKFNDYIKSQQKSIKRQNYSDFSYIKNTICGFLPFRLTDSQEKVLQDIEKDMLSKHKMNRLIQGDVGTGKTVLALIASAVAVHNSNSALVVAPTEILAKQHYQEIKPYFDKLNLNICLLTSSSTKEEKAKINQLQEMQIPCLIVGTQSLLNDNVNPYNLSLVIIDEQHRFGVNQRSKLVNKTKNCDLLMLSATPIPRSLSLVYYGGLDVSILENPPKEKHIQTNIISQSKEEDMWNFIKNKISQSNSKVYVVCANIDDTDDDCYQNLSANSMYKNLCKLFPKEIVELAHGKQDSETEQQALINLKNGQAKILVSTTIIEVGIDIKEADIIVIVSPEKFGLATLHQLRGRVGRAGQQAYCFCLAKNLNENSYQRIAYFKDHSNGFDIAEFDYKNRGAGDIYSNKQHGKIENIFSFISLETYNLAKNIYKNMQNKYNTDFLLNNKKYEFLTKITLN